MSRNQRSVLLALAVVVLVVGFVIAKSGGGSDDSSSDTTTVDNGGTQAVQTVVVQGGKPVGGIKVLKFAKGGTIRFRIRSDVADEVHFHGYDKHADVVAGGTVSFNVPATIDGKFVVELEDHKEQV